MQLYPKLYFDKITDITVEILEKNHIKGLMLDVDNTLIDYKKDILPGLDTWIEKIKESGINREDKRFI